MSCGTQRAGDERLALLDVVAGRDHELLAVRHLVLLLFADRPAAIVLRLNPDQSLAALFVAQANFAGDARR